MFPLCGKSWTKSSLVPKLEEWGVAVGSYPGQGTEYFSYSQGHGEGVSLWEGEC